MMMIGVERRRLEIMAVLQKKITPPHPHIENN
jgi:hypothetical protein